MKRSASLAIDPGRRALGGTHDRPPSPFAAADLVLAEDPGFYDDRQFGVYDRMRAEAPAYYYEPLDVFLLTRMDDVHYVSTHPQQFSNTSGLTLNQLRMAADGASTAFERFNDPEGELVITKDPPRQRALRALMSQNLTPRHLSGFEDALAGFCRDLLDQAAAESTRGNPSTSSTRSRPACRCTSRPRSLAWPTVDIPRMKTWVAALEDLTRITSAAELEEPGRRFDELKAFLRDQLASKRRAPGSDMMSSFLASTLDGAPAPDAIVLAHVATLMSNGGTTRLLLGSIASLLADHPAQLKLMETIPD